MIRVARLFTVLLAALCLAAFWTAGGTGGAVARTVLLDASADSGDGNARLRLRLSDQTSYRVQSLNAPYRLIIDLPPVDWLRLPAHFERVAGRLNGVSSVRYGWFQPGTYRIVLDLSQPAALTEVSIAPDCNAFVLTVSWQTAAAYRFQRFGNYAGIPVPKPPPLAKRPRDKPLVVIDAGHGGVDPGAIGVNGTKEKDIVLQAAKAVAAKLEETGRYRVLLTRKDDLFLKLGERVAIARRARADLFLSLHANTAASPDAAGLSVYSLSETASDKIAAALARKENKADIIAGVDLAAETDLAIPLLVGLARRETMNRSITFANGLLTASASRVPILRRAHRQAGFAVLKAPDVPSVLIELGFLSNADEEALLNSPLHLAQVSHSITAAVDGFFAARLAQDQ
jgi:N-acetylmuramoyl-L-alanine amidase